ncbi:MAG TPA: glycosyltransferase [Parvularculaceae bacterium]|nr:glycosyltransferase [Amphiplicatus sp.]MCB9954797.1 glycosyltransferase [Caulobacterales bacterium]HOP19119.1 glycosyltransferase [Amphiplicatus sp.]HPE29581.1 glycosyltransferase [Parvularculaceae bacterium]HRX38302.1 glycosyltransferase [Parvularculaceae bacterium]
MKLVHVFPSFARGGQQMRLAALVGGLGEEFRHRVISLDGEMSAREAFAPKAIEVETFIAKKSSGVSLSNIRGLAERIRGANILCTYNFGSLEAAIANRFGPRLPHLHFEDGFGPDESLMKQKAKRMLMRRLVLAKSVVVVPSHGLEALAKERWGLKRVRRIANGIDIARFASAARALRDGAPIVGSVGALRPEKNYRRLIAAFSNAGGDAKLVIHGEGPERESLAAAASEYKVALDLPGQTNTPEAALAAIDIFALSSDTEQMPLSLMEAMASGLPVISTDVGDVKQMVCEENREFITPLGEDDAYAKALRRLISDAPLRARLGAANAAKARAEFALDRMVADYRTLYNAALEGAW